MSTTDSDAWRGADRRTAIAAEMDQVRDAGLTQLPAGDGRTLISDAVHMYDRAAAAYEAEIKDVDKNWARLEVGAGDARRAQANAAYKDAVATAAKLGEAGRQALLEDLEQRALPTPPAPGSPTTMELRDELQMLIGQGNMQQLGPKLVELARGPRRDLAGLLFSPWFDSFAASRGGMRDQLRTAIRAAADEGGHNHGTPEQQKAASDWRVARKAGVQALLAAATGANARCSKVDTFWKNRKTALARVESVRGGYS